MKRCALLLSLVLASSASAQEGPITPPDFAMPGGSGCTAEIARYRAVQANDLAMGHVAKSVYAQIQREIAAAEQACAAGQDAKAMGMIRASQMKHGYPTHI
jgi:hypothetical protein